MTESLGGSVGDEAFLSRVECLICFVCGFTHRLTISTTILRPLQSAYWTNGSLSPP